MIQTSYKELFNLENKTAVVTGGLGILGKRFCMGLAEFGANVAVVDLDQEKTKAFAQELKERYQRKSLGIACDVASPKDVQAMVARVPLGRMGRPDEMVAA